MSGSPRSSTLGFMSCVREPSPEDAKTSGGGKRRFWNPKRWFRRKPSKHEQPQENTNENEAQEASYRCRSLSHISVDSNDVKNYSTVLSVSHDSVFQSDLQQSAESRLRQSQSLEEGGGVVIPDVRSRSRIDQTLQNELSQKLKLRRGVDPDSEDDEGLPRSPQNSTGGGGNKENSSRASGYKDTQSKSQSSCSQASLLSVGSLDTLDNVVEIHHHKSILPELRNDSDSVVRKTSSSLDLDLDVAVRLDHSGAHHRKSVQPRRTHGPPKRRKPPQSSIKKEGDDKISEITRLPTQVVTIPEEESITEHNNKQKKQQQDAALLEAKKKCASLPPGLVLSNEVPSSPKGFLSRSKSNVSAKSEDALKYENSLDPTLEIPKEKVSDSFFSRLFMPRRSAKKIKQLQQQQQQLQQQKQETSNFSIRPNALIKSGPSSRQRFAPQNLDVDEHFVQSKTQSEISSISSSSMTVGDGIEKRQQQESLSVIKKDVKIVGEFLKKSQELEQQRIEIKHNYESYSDDSSIEAKIPDSPINEHNATDKNKPRLKLAGLSSLQQRVLSLQGQEDEVTSTDDSDFPEEGYKSLVHLNHHEKSIEDKKSVIRSHSFKSSSTTKNKLLEKTTIINKGEGNKENVSMFDNNKKEQQQDIKKKTNIHKSVINIELNSQQQQQLQLQEKQHQLKQNLEISNNNKKGEEKEKSGVTTIHVNEEGNSYFTSSSEVKSQIISSTTSTTKNTVIEGSHNKSINSLSSSSKKEMEEKVHVFNTRTFIKDNTFDSAATAENRSLNQEETNNKMSAFEVKKEGKRLLELKKNKHDNDDISKEKEAKMMEELKRIDAGGKVKEIKPHLQQQDAFLKKEIEMNQQESKINSVDLKHSFEDSKTKPEIKTKSENRKSSEEIKKESKGRPEIKTKSEDRKSTEEIKKESKIKTKSEDRKSTEEIKKESKIKTKSEEIKKESKIRPEFTIKSEEIRKSIEEIQNENKNRPELKAKLKTESKKSLEEESKLNSETRIFNKEVKCSENVNIKEEVKVSNRFGDVKQKARVRGCEDIKLEATTSKKEASNVEETEKKEPKSPLEEAKKDMLKTYHERRESKTKFDELKANEIKTNQDLLAKQSSLTQDSSKLSKSLEAQKMSLEVSESHKINQELKINEQMVKKSQEMLNQMNQEMKANQIQIKTQEVVSKTSQEMLKLIKTQETTKTSQEMLKLKQSTSSASSSFSSESWNKMQEDLSTKEVKKITTQQQVQEEVQDFKSIKSNVSVSTSTNREVWNERINQQQDKEKNILLLSKLRDSSSQKSLEEDEKLSSKSAATSPKILNLNFMSNSFDEGTATSVVLRKKSSFEGDSNKSKKDETPELMKVFARRSLKVRDAEELEQLVLEELEKTELIDSKEALKNAFISKQVSNKSAAGIFRPTKSLDIEISTTTTVNEQLVEDKKISDSNKFNIQSTQTNNKVPSSLQNQNNNNKARKEVMNKSGMNGSSKKDVDKENEWNKFGSNKVVPLNTTKLIEDDIYLNEDKAQIAAGTATTAGGDAVPATTEDTSVDFSERKALWEKRARDAVRKSSPS